MSKIDGLKLREIEISENSQLRSNSYGSGSEGSKGSTTGSYGSIWGSLGSKIGSYASAIGSKIGSYGSMLGSIASSIADDLRNECEETKDCKSGEVCAPVTDSFYPFIKRNKCRTGTPKEIACIGKNFGDKCEFISDRGGYEYGECKSTLGPLHCSDFRY